MNQAHNRHPITYLVQTGDLWGVYCEEIGENWPRYNGTTLYWTEVMHLHLIVSTSSTRKYEPLTNHICYGNKTTVHGVCFNYIHGLF